MESIIIREKTQAEETIMQYQQMVEKIHEHYVNNIQHFFERIHQTRPNIRIITPQRPTGSLDIVAMEAIADKICTVIEPDHLPIVLNFGHDEYMQPLQFFPDNFPIKLAVKVLADAVEWPEGKSLQFSPRDENSIIRGNTASDKRMQIIYLLHVCGYTQEQIVSYFDCTPLRLSVLLSSIKSSLADQGSRISQMSKYNLDQLREAIPSLIQNPL